MQRLHSANLMGHKVVTKIVILEIMKIVLSEFIILKFFGTKTSLVFIIKTTTAWKCEGWRVVIKNSMYGMTGC